MSAARAWLRRSPALVVHVPAAALVLWLAAPDGGFPLARWGPAALLALGLVVVAVVALPRPAPSRPVLVALAALAAFAAWSYASIAWAGEPGEAWRGANRTTLGLLLFALAALWPLERRAGLALAAVPAAGIGVLGVVTLLRLGGGPGPETFVGTRLAAPAGYPNAAAALFLLGAWPALVLAARRVTPWPARALLAGLAVVLLGLALLCESRGAFFATPVVAAALLAGLPGRVRLATVLALAFGATAVVADRLLEVGRAIDGAGDVARGPAVDAALDGAVAALLPAALAVALAVGAWGLIERRAGLTAVTERRVHRGGAAAGAAALVALALVVATADPAERVRSAWSSFKGGYAENAQAGSRLTGGLGSDRYDFYRVALAQFRDAPVRGAGADQFRQRYLREGRGRETPRYPHSLPLRLLGQSGLAGTALFAAFVAAALLAALCAARAPAAATRAAAAAGVAGLASWLVHTSADWLAETAGLLAIASLLLGLAAGAGGGAAGRRPLAPRRRHVAAVVAAGVAAAAVLGLPWLADRDVARAGASLGRDPAAALARLDRAATLDPLSATPPLAEGTARLRLGDPAGADRAFREALERVPDEQYALLMRGAIASAGGRRAEALDLLRRAVALAPRDEVARAALAAARRGRIDLRRLQQALLARAA